MQPPKILQRFEQAGGSESFEGGISREHSDRSLGKGGLLGSQRGNSTVGNQRAFRAQHQRQTGWRESLKKEFRAQVAEEGASSSCLSGSEKGSQLPHEQQRDADRMFPPEAGQWYTQYWTCPFFTTGTVPPFWEVHGVIFKNTFNPYKKIFSLAWKGHGKYREQKE